MRLRLTVTFLIIIIFIVPIIFITFLSNMPVTNLVSIGISIVALLISIISSFKNEIFPGELYVYADGIHLVRDLSSSSRKGHSIQVLLPITFLNRGYGECVIQSIRMKVVQINANQEYIFMPSFEVDMPLFIHQNKGLHASNIMGCFVGFLLESKKGINKNLVFSPFNSNNTNLFYWKPDHYRFTISVKILNEKIYKDYFKIEKEITKETISTVLTQFPAVFLI